MQTSQKSRENNHRVLSVLNTTSTKHSRLATVYSMILLSLETELDKKAKHIPIQKTTQFTNNVVTYLPDDDNAEASTRNAALSETKKKTPCSPKSLETPSTPTFMRSHHPYVSFNDIQIRHYNVTLDKYLNEHDLGPALTLDWTFSNEDRHPVDEYERKRLPVRTRAKHLIALTRIEREELLQENGFHLNDLDTARQGSLIRRQWKDSIEL